MENKGFVRRLLPRFTASLLGSWLGLLAAAVLDTSYARAASDGAAFAPALLAELGLLAPLCLLVGTGMALVATLLLPPRFPRELGYENAESTPAGERVFRWLSWPVLAAAGTLLAGRLALRLFSSTAPGAAIGAAAALIALLIAGVVAVAAFGLARLAAARWPAPLGVRAAAPFGLGLGAAVLAVAIAAGTTSGSGGPLALFGVFKRPELDLRGLGLLLLVATASVLVPPLERRGTQLVAVLLALLPLGLSARAASSAFDERPVALVVERSAPLGKMLLAVARKLSDRDRDGFAARFGGGDCAEGDAAVSPEATDVPGNGRDEDCSGSDAKKVELAAAAPVLAPDAKSALRAHLPERPNVLFVSIDTLRFDLGYMGYERKITPNIDALAARSTVFEQAYSLASYTSKSLGPLLIGKYGCETQRGWSHFNRFPKDVFIAERLQKSGVRTVSVQGYWYFVKGHGLERGFDVVDSSASPKAAQVEGDRSFTSDKLSDAAIQQLQNPELDDKQFFFWVHYTDPHSEYVQHEGFDFGKKSRDLYDSEVAFVDHHVGRLLAALEAEPFAKRTLVVLTSDHGEAFGEHGMIRHGFEIWEELVRVPLLVHVPGAEPGRVQARRSAIDLVPTFLDVFGLEPPAASAPDSLSGVSLLGDVIRSPGYKAPARPVFVDMQAGPHNAERQAFIEHDMKLTLSAGRPLGLYDLKADAGEKKDLLDERQDEAKTLLERAKAFKTGLKEIRVKPE
jgi:choline-sulfatase